MSRAQTFRKKPVEVQAMQLMDNQLAVAQWIRTNGGKVVVPPVEPCLYIDTLEGRMRADTGDYVVRGVKGEFHPVKPDVFELTYERVGGER